MKSAGDKVVTAKTGWSFYDQISSPPCLHAKLAYRQMEGHSWEVFM